jgi:hypothetical protein
MRHTVGLVAGVIGLLLALEILNALFDAVCGALRKDMARKSQTPVWALPFALLRWLLSVLASIGERTSLITHEFAHAAAQFAFGGKPRIALLKNGGYAQSSPWGNAPPLRALYGIGGATGLGVMCAAPILLGAALLLVVLVATTPLAAGDIVDVGRVIGVQGADSVRDVLTGCWQAIKAAPWWAYPILIVVPLLLAPGMTPSSVDYVHGSLHLLAYGLGALACALVAREAPNALWGVAIGAGIAGVLAVATPKLPDWLRRLGGGLGCGTALIAIAMAASGSPLTALNTALGVILFALGIAAVTYVGFVALFLGLSLISVRPMTLWYALAGAPRHLIDLVRPFNTCETCRIHYRGKCDGCGRTKDQGPSAAQAA